MGLEETIIAELSGLKSQVNELIAWNAQRERVEAELHQVRIGMLENIQEDLKNQGRQIFEIAGAKIVAQQAARDIDEHRKDHKWWFGTVVTLTTMAAGSATFIVKNAGRLAMFFSNFGKPPGAHQ